MPKGIESNVFDDEEEDDDDEDQQAVNFNQDDNQDNFEDEEENDTDDDDDDDDDSIHLYEKLTSKIKKLNLKYDSTTLKEIAALSSKKKRTALSPDVSMLSTSCSSISNESIKKVYINNCNINTLVTEVESDLKPRKTIKVQTTPSGEKYFKSSLKKHSKYETASQVNKNSSTREKIASNSSTKVVAEPAKDRASPNSWIHDPSSISYLNASNFYNPNSYPRQTTVKSKQRHRQTSSLRQPPKSSYKNRSILKQEGKARNDVTKSDKYLIDPVKSLIKALNSLSSLDTLNDIDNSDSDNQSHAKSHITSRQNLANVNESQLVRYDIDEFSDIEPDKLNGIEQDWSYSLNNSTCFSGNDQRLINEIIRKLKPIIKKCVTKQMKRFIEKQMIQKYGDLFSKLSNINSSSYTNLEDF